MLDATCDVTGLVTAEGATVVDAQVLSQGKKASSGVLLIDQDKARYLTSNATDLHDTISSLGDIIDKISVILTALDAESSSPGGQTANITALGLLKTTLVATKDTLK